MQVTRGPFFSCDGRAYWVALHEQAGSSRRGDLRARGTHALQPRSSRPPHAVLSEDFRAMGPRWHSLPGPAGSAWGTSTAPALCQRRPG
ncbi:uncharacterized protein [Penaeus vannamei]|uniref:uncharacterized protein isoform X2 n=1 Tax=Penaeus vannamei TaxID=6689 RepID=UPI00387FA964